MTDVAYLTFQPTALGTNFLQATIQDQQVKLNIPGT